MNKTEIKKQILNDDNFLFEINEMLSMYCSVKYDFIENTGKESMMEVYGMTEEQFVNYDRGEDWCYLDEKNNLISCSKESATEKLKANIDNIIILLINSSDYFTIDLENKIIYS